MNNADPSSGALYRVRSRSGSVTIYVVSILVPVIFALIGFAVDLGMLYSIRGELKEAAGSMALAAAQQLIGTDVSIGNATAAAQLTIENVTGFGNKYYFHGLPIGRTDGSLTSTVADPAYFSTAADALASGASGVSGATAKYVRTTITGQMRLLFWSFIPIVTDRNVTVAATAVAGISPPLCLACGIEPFAVAAVDQSDTTDFGYTVGTQYTLAYSCTTGPTAPAPPSLPGTGAVISYILLNRLDPNATVFPDEASQAFRDGAGGLPGSNNTAQACFRVNNTEVIWASAEVQTCSATAVAATVTDALCGLDTRFESTPQQVCSSIPSIDTLASIYQPDPDTNDYDAYNDYTGNGRRVITIPVVDALNPTGNMTVLGFRQFLVLPNQGTFDINPGDQFGRFGVMYIGSVAPVQQGRFDGCQQTAGPGKVVLHQ